MNIMNTQKNIRPSFFHTKAACLRLEKAALTHYIKTVGTVPFLVLSLLLLLPDSFYTSADRFLSGSAPAKQPEFTASADSDDFCERIAEKILRLHILADNDSVRDQEIKLHVRDAVLSYAQPLLASASSAAESEKILFSVLPELIEIANRTLVQYDADYTATASISDEFFPIRRYGSLLLPPGRYRALRIVLGTGKGQNWWCMLYPSLCFTEGITGTISEDGQEQMEQLVSEDDYFLLFSEEERPKFSFRLAELFAGRKAKKRRKER